MLEAERCVLRALAGEALGLASLRAVATGERRGTGAAVLLNEVF